MKIMELESASRSLFFEAFVSTTTDSRMSNKYRELPVKLSKVILMFFLKVSLFPDSFNDIFVMFVGI